ncbi:hypothetical protein A9Q95_03585 [Rhodobacterales bacterium 59_46_T64]|nr:hypothetical protein A9Q95_03585 [Rhodobacterales bacterium 59_46_T64]
MTDAIFFVLLSLPFLAVLVAGYGGYRQRVSTAVLALVLMIGVPGLVLTAAYFISSVLGAEDPDANIFFALILMGHLGAVVLMFLAFGAMWRLRNAQERRAKREQGVFTSKRRAGSAGTRRDQGGGNGTGAAKDVPSNRSHTAPRGGVQPANTLEFSGL